MSLPNKCNLCGLKVRTAKNSQGESVLTDKNWEEFRDLQKKNIIPKGYPKTTTVITDGRSPEYYSYCAIDSNAWNKNNKKCDYFQLRIPEINLSDHVSIYTAKKIARASHFLQRVGIGVAAVGVVIAVIILYVRVI